MQNKDNQAKKVSARDVCLQVSLPALIDPAALKQVGSDRYKVRCPFHADATPSMIINKNKGRWLFRCFGCGAYGSVIDYVMLRDGISFVEALDRLGNGVVAMGKPPDQPPPWRVLKCIGGCGRTLRVDRVESLAFAYQKGWHITDDMLASCGRCIENNGG